MWTYACQVLAVDYMIGWDIVVKFTENRDTAVTKFPWKISGIGSAHVAFVCASVMPTVHQLLIDM